MGAQTMRRAAALMRRDYGESWQDEHSDARTFRAVADWLDKAATLREFLDREPEPTIFGRPVTPIETAWDKEALAVARAYLGEA